jgi:hypothetical protein
VGGEGFGTAAVEVDAGDVGLDGEGGFEGELGVGRAELEDEVGLFDGVRPPDGFVGSDVVDQTGLFYK